MKKKTEFVPSGPLVWCWARQQFAQMLKDAGLDCPSIPVSTPIYQEDTNVNKVPTETALQYAGVIKMIAEDIWGGRIASGMMKARIV